MYAKTKNIYQSLFKNKEKKENYYNIYLCKLKKLVNFVKWGQKLILLIVI